jgi:AraC-like DNA-binding protein
MRSIRIEDIAKQLNLDRRYLTRLFKEKTGQSIQEYLIQVRLEEAVQCLQNGYSVSDTAILCGYEDVSNFSKMFKKRYGISPAQMKIASRC